MASQNEKGYVVHESIPVKELPEKFADEDSKVSFGPALKNPKPSHK